MDSPWHVVAVQLLNCSLAVNREKVPRIETLREVQHLSCLGGSGKEVIIKTMELGYSC